MFSVRLSRLAATVTTAALAPVVLLSSPVFAAESAPADLPAPTAPDRKAEDPTGTDQAEQDRETILAIIADPMASPYMREAGRKAIADGPAAMRAFIETDQFRIRLDDYRVAVTSLLNGAGPGLKEGVERLLGNDGTTLEELRHFHDVTQYELRDQDNRVEVSRLIGTGGPAVREAGKKALEGTAADRAAFLEKGRFLAQAEDDRATLARVDEEWDGPILSEAIRELLGGSPTPAALRHFVEVTQYELRDQDNRVRVAQVIDGGGPELVKAGRAALAGTPADRVAFLTSGQFEARAKDTKARQENGEDKDGHNHTASGTAASRNHARPASAPAPGGGSTVTPQGGSGPALAATGAGDPALLAGGAGTALVTGAALLLAARTRRTNSTN
ncbi:ALF repeat-containing protein [Streptomyces sp. NPDC048664]|uniref:ALF repeat-containing protein n=1 Tax=Streptomyces sp. NPDC048664 TaxID=3154505 RepID=UPI00341EE9E6